MNPYGNERASAVATIKESVTAIEAFLNELAEVGYGYEIHNHSEKNPLVLMSRKLKEAEKTRESVKRKIQITCESLSGNKFQKGNFPTYQKLSLIVDVRNELTHPKASVITIGNNSLTPPKNEVKLLKKLRSYGFSSSEHAKHDWTSAVENRAFAKWAHLNVVEMMVYIFSLWPYPEAIDKYLELYGLDRYKKTSPTNT
ncbi:hypothetical protein [Herminiimonas fonticola]|uniref:hypothetical protein n=1 Tax=Herminiimonas fonticola TaxID=303380 RepID=UPI00105BA375|nr:hypothetical protein [Herminiimonas fonticola]